jgi:mannose-6-phosphate isomerase-like protein (cupin superfamily)
MAKSGQVIRNPVTGETVTFLETAADSGGRSLRIEMVADAKAAGAAEHVHPHLTERHEVQEGRLHFRVDKEERVLEASGRLEISPGTPHSFRNADAEPARVLVEYEPASRFEDFMEIVYRLAEQGRTNDKGLPRNFLQAAVIAQAYLDDIALPRVPLFLQRLLFGALAPIGRLAGYRAR